MDKQIIFTVTKVASRVDIVTKSTLADDTDRYIDSSLSELVYEMAELTRKYSKKNIAVLFEYK